MIDTNIVRLVIEALILVESGGNPAAVNGNAVGVLQIMPAVVHELNRVAGWDIYKLEDRLNEVASRRMARTYLLAKGGLDLNIRGLALLWKLGPDGMYRHVSRSDENYADRVANLVADMLEKEASK
jgi:hypothetical protein